MSQAFTAKLLPIGEPVGPGDPRMLAAGGRWSVRDGAPVFNEQREPVGQVTRVWVEDRTLMAAGIIDAGLDLKGLHPQVEFGTEFTPDPEPTGPEQVMVFPVGEVRGILLGTNPAYPSAWIGLVDV